MADREAVVEAVAASIAARDGRQTPYPHWFLENLLPGGTLAEILSLPFVAPDLAGVSGRRELHNDARHYFDAENQVRFPVLRAVAEAFQDRRVVDRVAETFGARLEGAYLRVEYAQDVDGFWLEPHTDLGVKMFTLLHYVSPDPAHSDLGTDIYDRDRRPVGRSPFRVNGAMVFVPSDVTFHGFERRPILGVRKSIIVNYVTSEWRAREQLAFPDRPVM